MYTLNNVLVVGSFPDLRMLDLPNLFHHILKWFMNVDLFGGFKFLNMSMITIFITILFLNMHRISVCYLELLNKNIIIIPGNKHLQTNHSPAPHALLATIGKKHTNTILFSNIWHPLLVPLVSIILHGMPNLCYPLVIQHSHGKSPFFMGKSTMNGNFQ